MVGKMKWWMVTVDGLARVMNGVTLHSHPAGDVTSTLMNNDEWMGPGGGWVWCSVESMHFSSISRVALGKSEGGY
jgi:hypothetical protein